MRLKKIVILLIVVLAILENNVYAKYVYHFDDTIIELTRDSNSPVCNVDYSKEEMTNENVTITITSNKEIEQVSGFELSEDKKILTKEVSKNENGMIKVRDLSGNYTEVEYNVNNIDKENPQIIGCEDGGSYQAPLLLDYSDNDEIKEIIIDRYSDNLTTSLHEIYYDSYIYNGIDRTDTSLTVNVESHPQNTKKYKYYINNQLYTTIADTNYTFTGLEKGTSYTIKIEAIDELGNVLDSIDIQGKTSYYHSIISNKTNEEFLAIFDGIDNSVSKIKYAVWNSNDANNIKWNEAKINNHQAKMSCERINNEFYPDYIIHAYMYDENNNILDVVGFSIDFGTNYENREEEINQNELTKDGNYQIMVSDFADNKTVYQIKVK